MLISNFNEGDPLVKSDHNKDRILLEAQGRCSLGKTKILNLYKDLAAMRDKLDNGFEK